VSAKKDDVILSGDGTMIVPFVRATIRRGYDVVVSDVIPSEVPILKAIHGDDVVAVDEHAEPGSVRISTNAEAELARLRSKYNRKGEDDVVRFTYPRGSADIKDFGFVSGGAAEERQQASVKVRKPVAE